MQLPSFIYRSERLGKNGKPFSAYKFKTLKDGTDRKSQFARGDQYLRFGKILRKYKLDEVLQLINVIRGEMSLVGPRPEEKKTLQLLPRDLQKLLLSRKPGLTSLASIHFIDEEFLLKGSKDQFKDYYEKIRPIKLALDAFYIQNHDLLLDLWIIWKTAISIVKRIFR